MARTQLCRWALLLLIVVATVSMAGCGGVKKDPVIGVCLPPAQQNWVGQLLPAATEALEQWGGRFEIAQAAWVPGGLQDAVQELIEKKVDAVILYPTNEQEAARAAQLLRDAKIPLILVGSPLAEEEYALLVAADDRAIGSATAQVIAQRLEGQGTVLILEGIEGIVTQERTQGFEEAIAAYPGIEVVGVESTGGERDVAAALTAIALEETPMLDAIFAHSDDIALGAIQTLEEEYAGVQIVTGIGGSREAAEMLMKNHRYLKATWLYSPQMAAEAVRGAVALLQGEEIPEDKLVLLPLREITALNAAQMINEQAVY